MESDARQLATILCDESVGKYFLTALEVNSTPEFSAYIKNELFATDCSEVPPLMVGEYL